MFIEKLMDYKLSIELWIILYPKLAGSATGAGVIVSFEHTLQKRLIWHI